MKRFSLNIFLILIIFSINSFSQTENTFVGFELVSIKFEGNDFASDGMLKSIILSKETPSWWWKFLNSFSKLGREPNYFDSILVHKDIQIINTYYKDNGFFKVTVNGSWEIDTTNKEAKIFFSINENSRSKVNLYKFPELQSKIDSAFCKDFIYDKFNLKIDKYYSREYIESDINTTLTELKNNGYMLIEKGNVSVQIDTTTDLVDITCGIKLGKYYTIDTILISKKGADTSNVSNELIYKIVNINKGDKYNLGDINQAQVRLYRTELFTSALINSVIYDTLKTNVPLKVSLDIGKINEVSPEIILNNQSSTFNIGFGAYYIRKNFFGGARKLTMSGTLITQDIFKINFKDVFGRNGLNDTTVLGIGRLIVGIEQPYFLENYITAELQLFGNIEQQKIYRYYTIGAKLGFKFDLPQFTFFNGLNTFIGFENEKIYIRKDLFKEYLVSYLKSTGNFYSDAEINNFIDSYYNNQLTQSNIILGVDILAAHANDLFFPTLGYNLQLNLENVGLLPMIKNLFSNNSDPNVQYYKINLQATTYTNPYKPSIGAVAYKLRLGYMHQYGGINNIPLTKLFYVGGSNSVRGWAARALGPAITQADSIGRTIQVFQNGGTFVFEGSIETRNRIIGDFGTAVFVDFGNSWENIKSFSLNSIAIAFGAGIRYYTSFVPFRLDFGFKLYDPYRKEFNFNKNFFSTMEINFGIGEAF